jgi:predicted DNA-binding transcriptional regulator AlpA
MLVTDTNGVTLGNGSGQRHERRRFIDRDQIAAKLSVKRTELATSLRDRPPLPEPAGYFRGRVIWDEQEIDAWISAHKPPPALVANARGSPRVNG